MKYTWNLVKVAATQAVVLTMVVGCGTASNSSSLKITKGSPVRATASGPERISTVGLLGALSEDQGFSCTAEVLADDLLVTAGHCVDANAQIFAFFGTDMNTDQDRDEYVEVTSAIVNPGFTGADDSSGELPEHDIAVLKLNGTVPSRFQPVALASSSLDLAADDTVRVAGFGENENGKSGILRYVDSTYAGQDDQGRLVIADKARRGACSGDSGGPLFAQEDGKWYLAGVLSGGPVPCRGIDIYTSVAAHRSFLSQSVKRLESAD